MIKKRNIII